MVSDNYFPRKTRVPKNSRAKKVKGWQFVMKQCARCKKQRPIATLQDDICSVCRTGSYKDARIITREERSKE